MIDREEVPAPDADREVVGTLEFHYLKSNLFRVVHVSGAYGGIAPDGSINMVLFSERLPIPDLTVSTLQDDGMLGAELREERVVRSGVVREVEMAGVMDLKTARSLLNWLKAKVELLEKAEASDDDR